MPIFREQPSLSLKHVFKGTGTHQIDLNFYMYLQGGTIAIHIIYLFIEQLNMRHFRLLVVDAIVDYSSENRSHVRKSIRMTSPQRVICIVLHDFCLNK